MYHYDIKTATSYGAVAMLKLLAANKEISFRKARLNTGSCLPHEDAESEIWPLIFECRSEDPDCREFEVRIYALTSGYGGTGPNDLLTCLKVAGFKDIDETEIFTNPEIDRTYEKK